jgi:hypothetical protein
LLVDGDVLTFGKVVGAGSYHVAPVVARVELLTGPSSFEPSADRALTPFQPSSPVLQLTPRRLSSGRYGLISASIFESDSPQSSSSISVSSDAASSPSEQESDLEDEQFCVPAVLRATQGKPSGIKIPAFRSFMREIYHTVPHSPVISDVPDGPLEDAPGSPPSTDAVIHPSPVVVVCEPPMHSHSPIDLMPSPSPPPEAQQSEPAVIGAWPASRPESPHHSSLEVEAGQSEEHLAPEVDLEPVAAPPSPCQTRIAPTNTFIELVHFNPQTPFFPTSGPFSNSIASDFGLPSILPPPPPPIHRLPSFHLLHKVVTECVNSEFKGSFKGVEARVIHHPTNRY